MQYLLFFLPFESLFYHLGFPVQSLWLVGAISFSMLPWLLFKFNRGPVARHVFLSVGGFLVLSVISYLYSCVWSDRDQNESFYLSAILRNIISLGIGISSFLFFRHVCLSIGLNKFFSISLASFWIIAFLVIVQYLLTGERANGFLFTEPSHLAEYVSFIIIPVLIMQIQAGQMKRMYGFTFSVVALLVFILSGSGTGIIRILCVAVGYILFSKARKLGLYLLLLISLLLVYVVYYLDDGNYLRTMLLSTASAYDEGSEQSVSVVDRGVILIIFDHFFSIKSFLGYGFASEATEYLKFIPTNFVSIISDVKQNGFSLSSLTAKVLVATGIPGLILYFFWFWGKTIHLSRKFEIGRGTTPVLFGMCAYSIIGLPVYSDIYIWFWFAVVETIIVKNNLIKTERTK